MVKHTFIFSLSPLKLFKAITALNFSLLLDWILSICQHLLNNWINCISWIEYQKLCSVTYRIHATDFNKKCQSLLGTLPCTKQSNDRNTRTKFPHQHFGKCSICDTEMLYYFYF